MQNTIQLNPIWLKRLAHSGTTKWDEHFISQSKKIYPNSLMIHTSCLVSPDAVIQQHVVLTLSPLLAAFYYTLYLFMCEITYSMRCLHPLKRLLKFREAAYPGAQTLHGLPCRSFPFLVMRYLHLDSGGFFKLRYKVLTSVASSCTESFPPECLLHRSDTSLLGT